MKFPTHVSYSQITLADIPLWSSTQYLIQPVIMKILNLPVLIYMCEEDTTVFT